MQCQVRIDKPSPLEGFETSLINKPRSKKTFSAKILGIWFTMENIKFWLDKSSKIIGFPLEIMRFRFEKSAKTIKLKYKQLSIENKC